MNHFSKGKITEKIELFDIKLFQAQIRTHKSNFSAEALNLPTQIIIDRQKSKLSIAKPHLFIFNEFPPKIFFSKKLNTHTHSHTQIFFAKVA